MEHKLNPRQKELIRMLIDDSAPASDIVPKDPARLLENLTACVGAINYADAAAAKMKIILGRILVAIQDNPSVYEKIPGVKTFDDFLTKYVTERLGLSRTNLYEAKRLVKCWPSLSFKTYAELGTSKLLLLAQFTSQEEPSHKKYIEEAKTHTLTELRSLAVRRRLIEKGADRGAVIVITCNAVLAKEWRDFIACGEIQSHVGSAAPAAILEALIAEAKVEWLRTEITKDRSAD